MLGRCRLQALYNAGKKCAGKVLTTVISIIGEDRAQWDREDGV